jgi:hypothetical protein
VLSRLLHERLRTTLANRLGVIEFEDNLSEVDKPPEIPAGKYNAEVQDIQVQTSQKGNKYYAIKFVIPPDELAADISDNFPDGAVLYWNRQVVPNKGDRRAMFNLRRSWSRWDWTRTQRHSIPTR